MIGVGTIWWQMDLFVMFCQNKECIPPPCFVHMTNSSYLASRFMIEIYHDTYHLDLPPNSLTAQHPKCFCTVTC